MQAAGDTASDRLLHELATLLARLDPVPRSVVQAAAEAYGQRPPALRRGPPGPDPR